MKAKTLVLAALFAATSVNAFPNHQESRFELESRQADYAPAESLFRRECAPGFYDSDGEGNCVVLDCGANADVDLEDVNTCKCNAPGATFTNADSTCTCGTGATLSVDGMACECTAPVNSAWILDTTTNKYSCSCPEGKVLKDGTTCVDTPNCGAVGVWNQTATACMCKATGAQFKPSPISCSCGTTATLSSDYKSCICNVPGAVWGVDPDSSTGKYACGCPAGTAESNGACVALADCGRTGVYSASIAACVCKAPGATFNADKTCSCGVGASLSSDGNSCVCSARGASWSKISAGKYACACPAGQNIRNGACVTARDCGSNAAPDDNDNCVCAATGATWNSNKTCTCGNGASLSTDGQSCKCSTIGATWNKDGSGKYSCGCPSGQTMMNGACTTGRDCGSYATDIGNACTCKAPGAKFNTIDQTCSCGTGVKLSTDGNSCVCPTSGAIWGLNQFGSYTCDCPAGQIEKSGVCTAPVDCGKNGAMTSSGRCVCLAPGATWNSDKTCSCGDSALLNTDGKSCKCSATGATWTKDSSGQYSCVCPPGQVPKNGVCAVPPPTCGSNATADSNGKCVCNAPGATFNSDNTCSCGSGASLNTDGKSCKCSVTGATWTKDSSGKYSCACPAGQIVKNGACATPPPTCGANASLDKDGATCVCKAPGATFKSSDSSCSCGTEASLSSDGKSCKCPATGAAWTKDSSGKYSCQCPAGQVKSGNGCIPDCGSQATYSTSSKACICSNKALVFNTKTKSCACPSGKVLSGTTCIPDCGSQAKYSKDSKSCVCKNPNLAFNMSSKICDCTSEATLDSKKANCICKKSGMLWGVVSHTCRCPKGMTFKGNKCRRN